MPDFRDAAFDAIGQILSNDSAIFVLTNDMGAMGLDVLCKANPGHVINMGIAEQNLMSVAAGLALTGKTIFVYGITSHMTLRCLEQFRLDACAMNLPVILLGVGSGLAYGADGPTHHAVNDLGAMGSIPGLTILNPADAVSTSRVVRWAYAQKTPVYVRLDKEAHQPLYEESPFDGHQGFSVLRRGSDLTIISTGMMVHRAIQVAKVLEEEGIHASVLDVFRLVPMNTEGIQQALRQVSFVVSLEEHAGPGGLGSRLAELVMDQQLPIRLHRLRLPEAFFLGAATRKWVHDRYGLSLEKVCQAIRRFIGKSTTNESRPVLAMTGTGDA